jgi:DNA polymerase, archaea type
VSSLVRLTKTPEQYLASRDSRRELPYEAMLASGRKSWKTGDRIRVYRTKIGQAGLIEDSDDAVEEGDRRDYDIDYYARLLRETFAIRLARALTPADYEAVFADPEQMSLFAPPLETIRTILSDQGARAF